MRWGRGRRGGVADVVAITSSWRKPGARIAVAEVKRTRADLLQDLRAKKMLKYQVGSSHCYLAATAEALRSSKLTAKEIIADLTTKGLPKNWGILELKPDGQTIRVLRGARSREKPKAQRIAALTRKIARSFCYRVLAGKFNSSLLG